MTDEIMRELHQIKDEMSAECNHDVGILFQKLKEFSTISGRKYVSFCVSADSNCNNVGDKENASEDAFEESGCDSQ